jgi:hypothetical protein
MSNDVREMRSTGTPFVLTWGVQTESEGSPADAAWWLAGGVALLAWTGLALLLTTA